MALWLDVPHGSSQNSRTFHGAECNLRSICNFISRVRAWSIPQSKQRTSRPRHRHTFLSSKNVPAAPANIRQEINPDFFFHGEPIILLDDIISGLNVSERTIRRYRDAGKLRVYESIEGNIKFVLQRDLDSFPFEQTFISSSHPEYRTLKRKPKAGGSTANTTTNPQTKLNYGPDHGSAGSADSPQQRKRAGGEQS